MTHLRELSKLRKGFITDICNNTTISKLLYYDTEDALSKPNVKSPITTLSMSKVYPLPYIPNIDTMQTTYVNVYFGTIKRNGVAFKEIDVRFLIASHYNVWILEDGLLRPEQIACEIEDIYNYTDGYGIGKMLYQDIPRPIIISDKIAGLELRYSLIDFN